MHSGESAPEAVSPPPPAAPEDPVPPAPEAEARPPDPCVALLEKFLEQARAGRLKQLVIGYLTTDNDASVRSTSMPAAVMGHLSRLIERRVNFEYDRMTRQAELARSPGTQPTRTGNQGAAPPENTDPPAEPRLPRKVRQMLKKAEKRKKKGKP